MIIPPIQYPKSREEFLGIANDITKDSYNALLSLRSLPWSTEPLKGELPKEFSDPLESTLKGIKLNLDWIQKSPFLKEKEVQNTALDLKQQEKLGQQIKENVVAKIPVIPESKSLGVILKSPVIPPAPSGIPAVKKEAATWYYASTVAKAEAEHKKEVTKALEPLQYITPVQLAARFVVDFKHMDPAKLPEVRMKSEAEKEAERQKTLKDLVEGARIAARFFVTVWKEAERRNALKKELLNAAKEAAPVDSFSSRILMEFSGEMDRYEKEVYQK